MQKIFRRKQEIVDTWSSLKLPELVAALNVTFLRCIDLAEGVRDNSNAKQQVKDFETELKKCECMARELNARDLSASSGNSDLSALLEHEEGLADAMTCTSHAIAPLPGAAHREAFADEILLATTSIMESLCGVPGALGQRACHVVVRLLPSFQTLSELLRGDLPFWIRYRSTSLIGLLASNETEAFASLVAMSTDSLANVTTLLHVSSASAGEAITLRDAALVAIRKLTSRRVLEMFKDDDLQRGIIHRVLVFEGALDELCRVVREEGGLQCATLANHLSQEGTVLSPLASTVIDARPLYSPLASGSLDVVCETLVVIRQLVDSIEGVKYFDANRMITNLATIVHFETAARLSFVSVPEQQEGVVTLPPFTRRCGSGSLESQTIIEKTLINAVLIMHRCVGFRKQHGDDRVNSLAQSLTTPVFSFSPLLESMVQWITLLASCLQASWHEHPTITVSAAGCVFLEVCVNILHELTCSGFGAQTKNVSVNHAVVTWLVERERDPRRYQTLADLIQVMDSLKMLPSHLSSHSFAALRTLRGALVTVTFVPTHPVLSTLAREVVAMMDTSSSTTSSSPLHDDVFGNILTSTISLFLDYSHVSVIDCPVSSLNTLCGTLTIFSSLMPSVLSLDDEEARKNSARRNRTQIQLLVQLLCRLMVMEKSINATARSASNIAESKRMLICATVVEAQSIIALQYTHHPLSEENEEWRGCIEAFALQLLKFQEARLDNENEGEIVDKEAKGENAFSMLSASIVWVYVTTACLSMLAMKEHTQTLDAAVLRLSTRLMGTPPSTEGEVVSSSGVNITSVTALRHPGVTRALLYGCKPDLFDADNVTTVLSHWRHSSTMILAVSRACDAFSSEHRGVITPLLSNERLSSFCEGDDHLESTMMTKTLFDLTSTLVSVEDEETLLHPARDLCAAVFVKHCHGTGVSGYPAQPNLPNNERVLTLPQWVRTVHSEIQDLQRDQKHADAAASAKVNHIQEVDSLKSRLIDAQQNVADLREKLLEKDFVVSTLQKKMSEVVSELEALKRAADYNAAQWNLHAVASTTTTNVEIQ